MNYLVFRSASQVGTQLAPGENGHLCSSQQQPPRKVPPAGRQEAASVPGGSSDAGSETLAEPGLRAGRILSAVTVTGVIFLWARRPLCVAPGPGCGP